MGSVAERFLELDAVDREWVVERAAIREFDGEQSRAVASVGALEEWERRFLSVMGRGE